MAVIKKKWLPDIAAMLPLALLFLIGLLSSCMKILYFVADPYWQTATQVSYFQIRRMGLEEAYLVRIVPTTENTPWLRAEEPAESKKLTSLKPRIERWLNEGRKVIMSPYWLRDMEEQPLEFTRGQLLLIDAVSRSPKIQSVITDMDQGYYEMGQIAGTFMQKHPERKQAIAIFYRGTSYDKYYESFTEGFKSQNPEARSMAPQRYYAAEINDINLSIEKLNPDQNLIILGMAHLSDLLYRTLSVEEQSLFMVENFGDSEDLNKQVLLSLDSDYGSLVQEAIRLAPLDQAAKLRITRQPYVLHVPNPELIKDIEQVQDLAMQEIKKQKRRRNRLDVQISRAWDKVLDFFVLFRLPDIPWRNWL